MDKQEILDKFLGTDEYKELESEVVATKGKEALPDLQIDDLTIRRMISETDIDIAFYVGLSEYETDGTWNEVRTGNTIRDWDAKGGEDTIDAWAEYFAQFTKLTNENTLEVVFDRIRGEFNKAPQEQADILEQLSEIANQ